MNTKNEIPEALIVLDLFISAHVDRQLPAGDQMALRKVRDAFAERIMASQKLADYPTTSRRDRVHTALAAAERLP